VQEVLTAIAKRKPVSEPVSDLVVQSLNVPAVAALLVNPERQDPQGDDGPDHRPAWKSQRLAVAAGAACRSFGRVPSAASARWWARPSWNGWRRAMICPKPPASI
jgi:hypothetical protein